MKRIFLLLLACGMFISTFAQKDTSKNNLENSEKWVITPVAGMKGELGRLNMNFPAGVDWNIWIYTQADNKFVNSFYPIHKKQSFNLSPGEYRIKLGDVTVENVSIQKGKETRIRAGVLNVADESSWDLYDDLKENIITTNTRPQKMVLPVGFYQIKIGENYTQIEIKDDGQKQIITESVTSLPGSGQVVLKFPLEILEFASGMWVSSPIIKIYKAGAHSEDDLIYKCGPCPPSYPLMEGNYDVCFDPSLYIRNVHIKKWTETRLSVGYLTHLAAGLYHLYDETFQTRYWSYHSQGPENMPNNSPSYVPANHPIPAGRYGVELQYVGRYRIQVKNGEITKLNPMDSALIPVPWSVKPLLGSLDRNLGRLNVSYRKEGNYTVEVLNYQDNTYIHYEGNLNYIDLLPGKYGVIFPYFRVDVNIEPGKETSIKFGYLKTELQQFGIRLAIANPSGYYSIGAGSYALPINYYVIRVGTRNYLIRIKEGETLEFNQ